jgi:hypothetical protein
MAAPALTAREARAEERTGHDPVSGAERVVTADADRADTDGRFEVRTILPGSLPRHARSGARTFFAMGGGLSSTVGGAIQFSD